MKSILGRMRVGRRRFIVGGVVSGTLLAVYQFLPPSLREDFPFGALSPLSVSTYECGECSCVYEAQASCGSYCADSDGTDKRTWYYKYRRYGDPDCSDCVGYCGSYYREQCSGCG